MDFLIYALVRLLEIYEFIILIRCILSFFGYSKIYEILCAVTEPVLKPIREILVKTPLGNMPLDFSAVFAMILIGVAERCLVYLSRML
ncbi:MAG: YggT family protein [Clostridia bacterium]|nr:YggT family protein [Clostridia bacterium]